jgi:hypothetical protein
MSGARRETILGIVKAILSDELEEVIKSRDTLRTNSRVAHEVSHFSLPWQIVHKLLSTSSIRVPE